MNAAADTTRDFPEWLSPIVVKELRQGMRSRLFVTSFLLLHGAMILVAFLALSVASYRGDTRVVSTLFWLIIAVPLLVVMPLSALGSVANERKANSLELIFLTRVTPRRILAGKWLAIFAQTVLLVCLVLPYVVLRYFLGGVEIGSDLDTLGMLLLGSALLSGVGVGISPQLSRTLRVILIVGAVLILQSRYSYILYDIAYGGAGVGAGPAPSWRTYLGLGLLALVLLAIMMEMGAAKIAPLVANHSTSRRLIALAAILITAACYDWQTLNTPLVPAVIALLAPICIGALCEAPSTLVATYRPFVRRGFAGRLVGRLLYPGWPSGLWFSLLVLALFLAPAAFFAQGVHHPLWIWWTGMTIVGALLLPAAVSRAVLTRFKRPLPVYLAVQALCALVAALAGMMFGFEAGDSRAIVAVVPATGLLLSQSGAVTDENVGYVLIGTTIITVASFVVLLLKMRKPWREIRALEQAASTPAAARLTDAPEPQPAR